MGLRVGELTVYSSSGAEAHPRREGGVCLLGALRERAAFFFVSGGLAGGSVWGEGGGGKSQRMEKQ